jgi:hypothetical protein
MNCRLFWMPRGGHTAEEYEDASAVAPALGRFAIADGATESSYAASWARRLVEAFVRQPACEPESWQTWLPPLQLSWAAETERQPLPWHAEAKLEIGAFATFLGIVVSGNEDTGNNWQAVAVGDSCVFHVRKDNLESFPISRSRDFNNRPGLVGSRTAPAELLHRQCIQTREGIWQPGDCLWLMTDALAQWFLRECEVGAKPWKEIEQLLEEPGDAPLSDWVAELRQRRELRNDDVTLLMVRL